MSDHEQSHPLNDSLAKPAAHRSNKLRISTTATAEMDNDMNKPADGLALPKIAKDSAPLTPASPRTDNENDDGSLPWSQWNSDKSSTEAYHTAPNSATSNSFPASPSSPAHSSTFRSGSGRSHRARSISSLQAFRRPSNAAAPATPSTSSVSNKIKGFISRDKSDKQTESKAAADSDDPLDQLINGDKTIHMTLTPKSIINLDKDESKVPKLSAAQARAPQIQPDSLSEFSQFIRSTGPPGAGPSHHQPTTPVAFDTVMENVEVEGDRSKDTSNQPVPTLSKLINAVPARARRKSHSQARGSVIDGSQNAATASNTNLASESTHKKGMQSSSLPVDISKPPPIPKDDDASIDNSGNLSKSCPILYSERAMHHASRSSPSTMQHDRLQATASASSANAHDDIEPPSSSADTASTRRSPVDRQERVPRNPIRDDCEENSLDSGERPGEHSAVSLSDFLQSIPAPAPEESSTPMSIASSFQENSAPHHERQKSGTFTNNIPGTRRMSRSMSVSVNPPLKLKSKKSRRRLQRNAPDEPSLSGSPNNEPDFMRPPSTSASVTPSISTTNASAKQKPRSRPSFLSFITRTPKLGSFSSHGTLKNGRLEPEIDRDSPYGAAVTPNVAYASRHSATLQRGGNSPYLDRNFSQTSSLKGSSFFHDRDSPYGADEPIGRSRGHDQASRRGKKSSRRHEGNADRDSPYGAGVQVTAQVTASRSLSQSRQNSRPSLRRNSVVEPSFQNQLYAPIQEDALDAGQMSPAATTSGGGGDVSDAGGGGRITAASAPSIYSATSSKHSDGRFIRPQNPKQIAVTDPLQDVLMNEGPTTPFTPGTSTGQHHFGEMARGLAEKLSRRKKSVS